MKSNQIGVNITELRKNANITQETLAKAIGVTGQAVSKWETGGSPDIELLVSIADYFQVSVDRLFGRESNDYSDMEYEIGKDIASLDKEDRFNKAFRYCGGIQMGLIGGLPEKTSHEDLLKDSNDRVFSQMVLEKGYSIMSLCKNLQYYLLMPEPECGWGVELGYDNKYLELFNMLGSELILKSIYLLMERPNKPFTPKLIERSIGISTKEAVAILEELRKYKLINTSEIELDDVVQTVFNFNPNPVLLGILAMCDAFIERPANFRLFSQNRKTLFNSH